MSALFPFALVVSGGVLCLFFRLFFFPRKSLFYLPLVLFILLFFLLPHPFFAKELLSLGKREKIFIFLLLVTAFLWHLGSWNYLEKKISALYETYAFFLFGLASMILFIQSEDLLLSFLALETFSFCLYALAGSGRGLLSLEAALKYFLTGSVASAFFLLAIALYFGATDTTLLKAGESSFLFSASVTMVLAVFFFKFSLFPFFIWVPDVYQGAPFPVTALMATAVKITLFPAILKIIDLSSHLAFFPLLLVLVAFFTQISGNLIAFAQKELKRFFAYSSIAQAGYLSLSFLTKKPESFGAYYLLAYALATLGVFFFFQELPQKKEDQLELAEIQGSARAHLFLWVCNFVFILSFTGIPFTGGFISKVLVFGQALSAGHFGLVLLSLINSVIAAGYYLKIPVAAFFSTGESPHQTFSLPLFSFLAVVLCLLGTLFLGFFPFLVLPFFALS